MSRFDFSQPPFDTLSPAERDALEARADIVYFPDDAVVIAPNQAIDAMYVVIKGKVCELADEEVVARYHPRDSFDARALIAGQTPHRFLVEEEALLFALPRAELLALTENNPRFGAYFYAGVSHKLGMLAQRAGNQELQTLLTATVRDAGCRQPVFVDAADSIRDAAAAMKSHRSKSVLVRAGERLGIFTTTDFRDIIVDGVDSAEPVGRHCGYDLLTIDIDDFLFNALLLMTQRNLRRLVVTDRGSAVGILAQVDVLSYFSNHSHLIAQRLEQASSLDELSDIAGQIDRLIRILSGHGVRPPQLGRLVQALNARLFSRAWRMIAPADLVDNSCLIVLGSEGRGEQILKTDQDNALLLRDGYAPERLAEHCQAFSAALARFGYPPCPGGVMVSNPEWRLTRAAMRDRIHGWLAHPSGEGMMRLAIFCDAEAVCGDASLLQDSRAYLRERLQDDAGFYARFARAVDQFDTPLGPFSRLRTREHEGQDALDLKKGGIFPLVHGLRALALENSVAETASPARAQALVAQGRLEPALADDVCEALSILAQLRLEHGLRRMDAGQPPDNLLPPEQLSTLERDLLKEALAVVKRFKALLRHHFRLGSL
ncbi:putative nucleotidyltransferase substrate binding domain-containing protein [Chromobacterium paludis]|uniref:Cyclic nucleotide-binding/CBS domain-containing protein n=1 Tax=Chromobacterium paludis TaxID=2605945 RepID=A0A5C1DFW1_9NEIS|nr:putative nucleotidyltransferase substrate binding domain-containing protein [Chromobacterium paludis]QEL55675.1 cyclic nucleotide-binding/CBS domain-containing protein [Chromobacterium paludis]